MQNYFLYTKSTGKTGKELVAALKAKGVNIEGGSLGPNNQQIKTLIRWGACKTIGQAGKTLNSAKSIGLASNKIESLKVLEKNGVPVPKIFDNANQIKPDDFPVFGRKVHHIGGNDIVLCMQKSDLTDAMHLGCSYFTKYIPTAVEYRLHIFEELSIKASQKILTYPELNKDPWIRNFDEGYTFHAPLTKVPKEARELAKKAVKVLGLTFGAVDIVIGDNGKPYILEVNTAPGLKTDDSIEVYVEKFKAALV